MSFASLSARDLRTLRRLVRTSTLFPFSETEFFGHKNQKAPIDPVYFVFAIGGESLHTSSRRRLRQAIQSIPNKFNLPLSVQVTIRSGRGERQDYRLLHPTFVPFRSLLEGEGAAVYIKISPNSGSINIQSRLNVFFTHRVSVFRLELGRELGSSSNVLSSNVKNGPSSRFFRISFPSVEKPSGKAYSSSTLKTDSSSYNLVPAVALRSTEFSKTLTNYVPSVYSSVAPQLIQSSTVSVNIPTIPVRVIRQTLSLIVNLLTAEVE